MYQNDDYFRADELHTLGVLLAQCAEAGDEYHFMLPLSARTVVVTAVEVGERPITLAEGFALVAGHWNSVGELAVATQQRLGGVLSHAMKRAEQLGLESWLDFDPIVAGKFVNCPTTEGLRPSVSTRHLRRSALRAAFTTLRRLGLGVGDPTLDLVLPPRSQLAARAATDDEIALLRLAATSMQGTVRPAVLALAEATSSTTETPRLTALDLDDPESPHIVRLPGSTKVRPRNGHLTDWGSRVMAMWVRDRRNSGVPDEAPLTYGGTLPETASPQASTCVAFRSIMRACGLDREQDLRPRSIIYWAGRQAFDQAETERIEAAARAMGVSSLDRAARQIDYSWDLQ